MAQTNPIVEARITLLRTEEGGRRDPLVAGSSYRPNHNFFEPDSMNMSLGEIILPGDRDIAPGDIFETTIEFAYWPGLDGIFAPGLKWRIQQGYQLVAFGEVIRVV